MANTSVMDTIKILLLYAYLFSFDKHRTVRSFTAEELKEVHQQVVHTFIHCLSD